jgi:hypothetical protein
LEQATIPILSKIYRRYLYATGVFNTLIGFLMMFGAESWFHSSSYDLLLFAAPVEIWGALFIITGIVAFVAAQLRSKALAQKAIVWVAALTAAWTGPLVFEIFAGSPDVLSTLEWCFILAMHIIATKIPASCIESNKRTAIAARSNLD